MSALHRDPRRLKTQQNSVRCAVDAQRWNPAQVRAKLNGCLCWFGLGAGGDSVERVRRESLGDVAVGAQGQATIGVVVWGRSVS